MLEGGGGTECDVTAELAALRARCAILEQALAEKAGGGDVLDYERALKDSQALYHSLVENIPLCLFRKDCDGRFVFANRRFCEHLGVSVEDIVGKTDADFFPARIAEKYRKDDCRIIKEGTAFEEVEEHSPVGQAASLVQVIKTPLRDASNRVVGVQGIFWDITQQKRAEEALRESRAMLQMVLDTVPSRVFWKDTSLTYMGCNRPFAHDAGLPEPEVLAGRTDFEMGWAEQAELYRSDDLQVIQTGVPKLNYEEPQRSPDGSLIWLRTNKVPLRDASGNVKGILGTYDDITAWKRSEEALRESQRILATLTANLPGMAYRCRNDESRTMIFISEGCRDLTGYASEDLVSSNSVAYADLIRPDHRGFVWDSVQESLTTREPFEVTYPIRTADGSEKWVWERGRGVFSERRDLLFLEGFITDITARKRAEDERRKLEAQVQHAQKLESLGVLAGGIAHDFNNLLMAVLGNLDLALADISPVSPVRENLLEAEKASRRAADLCRQMLAYSGKGRFVIQPLDLSEVVEEMCHMLEVSISKKAVLRYDLAEGLPSLEADASQMRQIIMNLVINASEAIGEKSGIIRISTGATECDRAYLAGTWLDDSLPEGFYVHLEVSDTGCGMDDVTRAKIFDPFFSTKFAGRGLGLAAVLGIVRGHSGAIKVYSEPGRGTTFRVLFPAVNAPSEKPEKRGKNASTWRGSGTVLLVDDEETVRAVGKKMLQRIGFSVLTAVDGREAVDVFRRNQEVITCVLLDLTMPHMDGEEAYRELRRMCDGLRVIVASGYSEQEVAQRFLGKGVAAFIQKPYQLATLTAKLQEVLSKASELR